MDFREIVKSVGKTHAEAATAMYPGNKYAYQAYTRQACEGLPLNELQLQALAEVTGYSICQIMEMRANGKQHVQHTPKKETV